MEDARRPAQDGQGPGRFIGFILRGYKAPAAEAAEIAGKTKELKKEGDVYSSELTDEGAKNLLMFRGGRGGQGNAPTPSKASGSVKFWVKDGKLSRYEYKVSGTVTFNGEDRDIAPRQLKSRMSVRPKSRFPKRRKRSFRNPHRSAHSCC